MKEKKYRTAYAGTIQEKDIQKEVKIAGFVENIRDHGGIIFVDVRDSSGVVQIVSDDEHIFDDLTRESTVTLTGTIRRRDEETINPRLKTGELEILVHEFQIITKAKTLPFDIMSSTSSKEDIRFKYRYLDLRNEKVKSRLVLRSQVISAMRRIMEEQGFVEIQTPILTTSSPEGARDYLVPSRLHHGKFYALPQAPQIFKQLLMASGFDRYFQVAPCFRDEDARSDRTPGEFYQLDFEMAFVTKEEVYEVAEQLLTSIFTKYGVHKMDKKPFRRIAYDESMLKYGTDKPDLRNPLEIIDLTKTLEDTTFKPFQRTTVRGIIVEGIGQHSNSWFNEVVDYAKTIKMPGIGYLTLRADGTFKGPIDKFLSDKQKEDLKAMMKVDDVLFFIADRFHASELAGKIRTHLGEKTGLTDFTRYEFCFIEEFPMYEFDEDEDKIVFTHNPFSMPQGDLTGDPLKIKASQYDVVCNGIELSSGAVRCHDLGILEKSFAIAGYTKADLMSKFKSLATAFQYGVPPHAGLAPGIDRNIMLLDDVETIRVVIAFPLSSQGIDPMTGGPLEVTEKQLRS